MLPRASLLASLLVSGCNSDALVIVLDGAAPADRSGGRGLDIAMPDIADLMFSDLAPPHPPTDPYMWIRQFGTAGSDEAHGVATDAAGNAYVTGITTRGLDGNQNVGLDDAFLVKYDVDGNKDWTRQLGTADNDRGYGVAADGMGNVFVTGGTYGGLDGNQNAGGQDAFLVKYDATGNKLWTRQFGTPTDEGGAGVATDGAGNVYVAGYTLSGLDGYQNVGTSDAFLVKYDTHGNKLWSSRLATWSSDAAAGVATDAMGNVCVTGVTEGRLGHQNAGGADAFLVKYEAKKGISFWTSQVGTQRFDAAFGVATDDVGDVFVTGATYGGLDGNQNAGGYDAFLVKHDSYGKKLWTRQFGTPAWDLGTGVATDAPGNVYVTGWTEGGLDGKQNAGGKDAFLVKYNTNGNKLWTRQWGTVHDDRALGVAADGVGGTYVTGMTEGALAGYQNAGRTDAFLARFPAAP